MVNFPPPNLWQMMIFLNPLNILIPKIPFSFFLLNFGSGSPPGPGGSVSVGFFLGGSSIEPFLGGARRSSQRPASPQLKARPAPLMHTARHSAHSTRHTNNVSHPLHITHCTHYASCAHCTSRTLHIAVYAPHLLHITCTALAQCVTYFTAPPPDSGKANPAAPASPPPRPAARELGDDHGTWEPYSYIGSGYHNFFVRFEYCARLTCCLHPKSKKIHAVLITPQLRCACGAQEAFPVPSCLAESTPHHVHPGKGQCAHLASVHFSQLCSQH